MSRRPVSRWLFGKMPAQGDFVSRGIGHAFRDTIDHWLSGEMAQARTRFGVGFDERFFNAPAWLFVDRDPNGQWTAGALCASVDAVGRQFPLIAGMPAADADDGIKLAAGCRLALEAVFAQGLNADQLIALDIPPVEIAWAAAASAWAVVGETGPPFEIAGRYPDGVIAGMLELAG